MIPVSFVFSDGLQKGVPRLKRLYKLKGKRHEYGF